MEQQLVLNPDWLAITLRITGEIRPIAGHVWREYPMTNVWAKRRILWSEEGDKVLTLLSEPRSSTINSKIALCEIENEWLYHGGGYHRILQTLGQGVLFEVIGLSRLDLAVDFTPTAAQKDIIIGLATGEYYAKGKENRVPWWGKFSDEKLSPMWRGFSVPYDQSWGHKTSAIKWKLYYKSKELLDAGGGTFFTKPYIVDQWRLHGMDVSNVWRVEVSMKQLNNYSIYGHPINLDYLDNNMEELFLQMYDSRFKIRLNEGHKDKSNDKEVTFLPLPKIAYTFSRRETKSHREHYGRITLLRHLVQSMDDEHILLDEPSRNAVFDHMRSLIRRDNLQNYFYEMTGNFLDDYIEKKLAEAEGRELVMPQRPNYHADIKPNPNADQFNPDTQRQYEQLIAAKVAREIGSYGSQLP